MCCGCGSGCATTLGNLVYVLEKLASFAALTAVVLCIMTTVAISLGLGVGLGYNYCFVDLRVMTEEPTQGTRGLGDLRSMEERTDMPNYRRSQGTTVAARRTMPLPAIKNTMALPLSGEYDFPTLLSKLRARNRNVTLELIT